MIRKKFGMISLGCDKNRVDGERLLGEIRAHGCEITDDIAEAEVLIVNTCAFLQASREESIQTILECNGYREGKLEKLVVTGCLPQKYIDELYLPLSEADVFLGIHDAPALFEALEKSYAGERVNYVGRCDKEVLSSRVVSTMPHLAYLKISDGCFNHCTYCLIPKIRGKYRSYPMDELVKEASELGNLDELVLVAQDTTRYGEDLYGENKFVELIQRISALENVQRIRLLYCYPEMIDDKLIEEIRTNEKLIHYLDIPLQHSENRILKLMGRRGTKEEYLALFDKLKKAIPDIAIRTTFICGFPTETEEEHLALKKFISDVKFTNCGFFAYSKEPDTPAYKMAGHIHHATKKRWVRELYEAQAEVAEEIVSSYHNKQIEVVCDGVNFEKSCFEGRAYFQAVDIDGKVYFTAPKAETGKRYTVTVDQEDTYDLYGHVEV